VQKHHRLSRTMVFVRHHGFCRAPQYRTPCREIALPSSEETYRHENDGAEQSALRADAKRKKESGAWSCRENSRNQTGKQVDEKTPSRFSLPTGSRMNVSSIQLAQPLSLRTSSTGTADSVSSTPNSNQPHQAQAQQRQRTRFRDRRHSALNFNVIVLQAAVGGR
jgi:hypothetical protein